MVDGIAKTADVQIEHPEIDTDELYERIHEELERERGSTLP